MRKHLISGSAIGLLLALVQLVCTQRRDIGQKRQTGEAGIIEQKNGETTPIEKGNQSLPDFLRIRFHGPQSRDSIRVEAEVTNTTDSPIGWDSEFSIFLTWKLHIEHDRDCLPWTEVSKLDQTPQSLAKTRFVRLKPGETRSRLFDLTKPFRMFRYKRERADELHAWPSDGYESMIQFAIPRRAPSVSVVWEYNTVFDVSLAFKDMFGFDIKDVGMKNLVRRSNMITIKFDD